MTVQRSYGSFPQLDTGPTVIFELGGNTAPAWTAGAVRNSQLELSPGLGERWTITGWTLRAAIGYLPLNLSVAPGAAMFAKLGDLWAGLVYDGVPADSGRPNPAPGQNSVPGGAAFPIDLSTFTKVWAGDTDPLPQVLDFGGSFVGFPIATTFMLPAPLEIRAGASMAMQLVLTPTLSMGRIELGVKRADFTVLYEAQPVERQPGVRSLPRP